MEEKETYEEVKTHEVPLMYQIADRLVECLYINNAELSNTGDSF